MEIESSLLNPDEFDSSLDSSSNSTVIANNDTEMSDLEKIRAEFLAFKMFATEQFYLLKQSVGIPNNSGHINSNSEMYINHLNEQIQYLKQENKTKNSIIQSLVRQNSLIHDLPSRKGIDNNEDENNSKISQGSILDENSPINENNLSDPKISDVINTDNEEVKDIQENRSHDQNKHTKVDQKYITNRKAKKKKKEKDHNEQSHNNENNKSKQGSKNDNNEINKSVIMSPSKSKETVFILGDSMVKKVNGFHLTKHIKHKYLVKVRSFSSAKTRCMHDHVKPTMRDFNPERVILHVGTNDLNSDKTASQIANSIVELALSLKNDNNKIYVSLIVPRNDNLNNKVNEVNERLKNMCQHRGIEVINHSKTIIPGNHLNESQLHLNRYGNIGFTKNFKNFLWKLD